MNLFRRYVLLPKGKRIVANLLCVGMLAFVCRKTHDKIDDRAERARTLNQICADMLGTNVVTAGKTELIRHGESIRQFMWNAYNANIAITTAENYGDRFPEYTHYSWTKPDVHNGWVISNLRRHQIFIEVPQEVREIQWMNHFATPNRTGYDEPFLLERLPLNPSVAAVTSFREMSFADGKEQALVAIAYLGHYTPELMSQVKTVQQIEETWLTVDRLCHGPVGILILLGVIAVLCAAILSRWPQALVEAEVERHDLDDARSSRLSGFVNDLWLSGMSRHRIEHRASREAKRLRREQDREEARKRSDQLRQLTDETRARKLAELAERRSKLARERMRTGETSLGAELVEFRKSVHQEGSEVAAVLESGFFHALTDSPSSLSPSAEGRIDESQESYNRIAAERVIRSCSQALSPLDRLTDDQVVTLAAILRRVKRKLDRDSWKEVCDRFDDGTPHRFVDLIQRIDREGVSVLNRRSGSSTSARLPSVKRTGDAIPKLLLGKTVILVGGDPGLTGFYQEQLHALGANVLLHHLGGNPVRMKNFRPDLILILWRRTDHKAQQMARSMDVQTIFLDKLSRSSFLTGAIDDIRAQLSS